MNFHLSADIQYAVLQPSTLILNLHALQSSHQQLENESFLVTEGADCELLSAKRGANRYARIQTRDLTELKLSYSVMARTNPDSRSILQIDQVPIADLHQEAMPYLFPSRYCQSDRLSRLAARLFGGISHPLDQATEVSNWIYHNLEYTGGVTDTATSACDTLVQRAGVCRDFAHLGIALCRALSIPSRYCAGYACNLQPQDFHAWFEVSVGNQWFSFDPTRLSSPDGLVRIARGRDAADASFATVFGAVQLQSMQVCCTSPDYRPFSPAELEGKVILLEP